MTDAGRVTRTTLEGAVDDRLFFAQVREDPLLEIEALGAGPDDTVVVVSSGGCTALSLLAAGAGRVVGVDLNRTQNHLVELKLAAVGHLEAEEAVRFLGGWPGGRAFRWSTYQRLRGSLTPPAQAYWDQRRRSLERGVLGTGVSERFIGLVMAALRLGIHPPAGYAGSWPARRSTSSGTSTTPSGTPAAGACCSEPCSTGRSSAIPTTTPFFATSTTPASPGTSSAWPATRSPRCLWPTTTSSTRC